MAEKPQAVYACIAAVSAEIAQTGIAKSRNNAQQGYKFRGIDDVYNALAPMLAKHGLVILPRILSRQVTERTTAKGGVLFNVAVEAEFDFVATADGSIHVARTYGEAMDSGDKATNKAMSAAYKYVTFQAFCIPTEGDNDTDATTHEPAPHAPDGYEEWLVDLASTAEEGTAKLQETWRASKPEYRKHLTTVNPTGWEALKKLAADRVAA
jgi:hypothetical protein